MVMIAVESVEPAHKYHPPLVGVEETSTEAVVEELLNFLFSFLVLYSSSSVFKIDLSKSITRYENVESISQSHFTSFQMDKMYTIFFR